MASVPPAGNNLHTGTIQHHDDDAHALVGRTTERSRLRAALESSHSGSGRLVLIGGEAGIGKTALVRDLARTASRSGVRVLTGHCFDLTGSGPYAPWLEIVHGQAGEAWPDLPDAFAGGRLGRVTDQAWHQHQMRMFLSALSQLQPTLVVLEDLHWADPASMELLRSIAPHLAQMPALIVATYRDDEPGTDAVLGRHLAALARDDATVRIDVGRLSKPELRDLVNQHYRLANDDVIRLVSYLDRTADGVPFFALELLHALETDGLLRRGRDFSQLGELDRVVVPRLTRQVIEGRLAHLRDRDAGLLSLAAVIGMQVPVAIWQTVSGSDEDELIDTIERLVAARLIEADQAGTSVAFVHALSRDAIYEGVVAPRRRRWHAAIAEALAAQPDPDPDGVAWHFERAGDKRAMEWLEQAAERAWAAYAWVSAAERLRSASLFSAGDPSMARRHHEMMFRHAYLQRFSEPLAGLQALSEVVAWAERTGDWVLATEVEAIQGVLQCYADRWADGVASIERSLALLRTLPKHEAKVSIPIRVWTANLLSPAEEGHPDDSGIFVDRLTIAGFDTVHSLFAWYAASAGRIAEAEPVARTFIETADGLSIEEKWILASIGFAHHGLAMVEAATGSVEAARVSWAIAARNFEAVRHFAVLAFARLSELRDVVFPFLPDQPALRRRLAAEAEAAMVKAGGAFRPGVSPRIALLGCLVMDGQWEEVDAILRELPNPGVTYLRREVLAATVHMARFRDETDLAWQLIHSVLPLGPVTSPGNSIHQEGLFCIRVAIHLAIDAGDLDLANSWMKAHDRWLEWNGARLGRAAGTLSRARLHLAGGDLDLAEVAAAEAIQQATSPHQPLIVQAAHQMLAEVGLARDDLELASEHAGIAHAISVECETPLEQSQTLLIQAQIQLARGDQAGAAIMLEEAAAIAAMLSASRIQRSVAHYQATLDRPMSQGGHPAGLTRREIEVLHLLAVQKTDREIADALFISVHTASTHVKHVLSKLQVGSRRDAVDAAIGLGLLPDRALPALPSPG